MNSWRRWFSRKMWEREMNDELRFHIERQTVANLASGMTPEEARRQARLQFGAVEGTKESCREERRGFWLETLAADARYALRMLRNNPSFTLIAILTLALGIGANTALFSVVNGVLLDPLPYAHPEELVTLHESKPNFDRGSISYPNFLDWQKDNHTFSAIAVTRSYAFSLTGMGDAEQVTARFVSTDFFPLFGVQPVIGRAFAPGEDRIGGAPIALISAGFWKRKFGSAPDALGKSVTLDGRDYTVVGVIPANFDLQLGSFRTADLYVPIGQWTNNLLTNRGAGLGIHGVGRLKPGVSIEQARADMDQVTQNLAAEYPDSDKGIGASLIPIESDMVGDVRPVLFVLLGAVGFVLLIACVNVANLMLVRSTTRMREFSIRAALGAGRARLVRQLLTESVLLALAGGGLGLLVAHWFTRAALGMLPVTLPRAGEIGLDTHVMVFTIAISLLAGILFGLAPALKTSQANLQDTLKESGRGSSGSHHWAQGVFVVVEMAMALVLLIGAGLMIRSLTRLWSVNPGFDPHNVLTFNLTLPPSMLTGSPDAIRAADRELEDKFESTPGVEAAALVWEALPMSGDDELLFWLDEQPAPSSENDMNWALDYVVDPHYLKAMRIPLLRGRFFTPQDNEHAPLVAVIDDVLARKFFPNEDPVGRRIHIQGVDAKVEIVGVVGHVKQWGLDRDDTELLRAQMYVPCMQKPDDYIKLTATGMGVVVRSREGATAPFDSLRRTSNQMNSKQTIYGAQTMDEIISSSLAARRFSMILLGTFAALALLLSSVGIYGVVSYLIGQRTHEIGIRMALGAQRKDVLGLVLGEGLKMSVAGVAMGLAAAIGLTRFLAKFSMLFGVSATDPLTFAGVAVFLTLVALVACWIPARRAMRVDPMMALRYE
jgi:predicted permease